MNWLNVGFVLGLLACVLTRGDAVDCTSKASLEAEQRRCFSRLELEVDVGSDEIMNVIQKDPEVACRHPDLYKSALSCAMSVSIKCLRSVGQSTDILPSVQNIMAGVNYFCNHIHSMDAECVKNKQSDLKSCAMREALSAFTGSSNLDITHITCKAFEITIDCLKESLQSCGHSTVKVMVHFTKHYLTPTACGGNTLPVAEPGYRISTVAPIMTAQMVTVVPMMPEVTSLPDVSCYSESSIQRGQQQCFHREDINVQLPQVNVRSQAKQSYLDAMLANNRDIHTICRRLTRYQRAMSCAMDVARQCMPSGYKDYVPSSSNLRKLLFELCQSADDVNQKCVTTKASALFDCGYNKGMEFARKKGTKDVKGLLCNAFKWNVECQISVLPPCGCATTELYARISKQYLNPAACPAISTSLPVCSADSQKFSYAGDATQSMASKFVTMVTAIFACLIFSKL